MQPGDTTKGEVLIKNTGTLGGAFTLDKGAMTDNGNIARCPTLNIKVIDCGPDMDCATTGDNLAPVYNGTLRQMGTAP